MRVAFWVMMMIASYVAAMLLGYAWPWESSRGWVSIPAAALLGWCVMSAFMAARAIGRGPGADR